jgi:hypothetical protein
MPLVDMQGREMTVRLISSDGTTVRVTRQTDQQTFSIPLDRLNAASRQAVRAWADKGGSLTETFEIAVDTGKTRKTTNREGFDDKRVNLSPRVTITNPHLVMEAREAKVTAVFLGRPVNSNSDVYVFRSQNFDLPRLKPGTAHVLEVAEISQAYDNRGYAQFGARYTGYAVLIHSADGKTIYGAKSIPESLATKFGPELLKLQTDKTYDDKLGAK